MTELRDEEDRREFQIVKTDVTLLKSDMASVKECLHDIKAMMEASRVPRPTNWVGICSFGLALTLAVGSFVAMWLQLRLTPIEKDVRTLTNDFTTQSARVQRDLEWFYSAEADRHSFNDRVVDRIWDRVFSGDPPKFVDKPKP